MKHFCHNKLHQIRGEEYTVHTVKSDLEMAILEPRFEGEGRNRHNVNSAKKEVSWLDRI